MAAYKHRSYRTALKLHLPEPFITCRSQVMKTYLISLILICLVSGREALTNTTATCGHPTSADIIHLDSQFRLKFFPAATALAQAALRAPTNSTKKGGKILGGLDVNDPTGGLLCWQVAIKLKSLPAQVRCGGSIIGTRTILTAGHCVNSNRGSSVRSADSFIVVVGALDSSYSGNNSDHGAKGCGRTYGVARVIQHPNFQAIFLNNDVALLILEEDINLSARCSCSLCLSERLPAVGEWCVNSGYGQESDSGTGDRSPVPLKFIYQQILENMVSPLCQYSSGVQGSNFICAGGIAGTDNCYGDSGGPLVCYDPSKSAYYQSGIVSYGVGVCGSGQGSRYTSVPKYLDWILSNSRGNVVSL